MVGKTSLVLALTRKAFRSEYEATITPTPLKRKLISSDNGVHLKCEIVDTPGRDKYIPLIELRLQDIDAAIVCYDITSKDSFDNIDKWLGLKCIPEDVIRVIVGCKTDLESRRQVTEEMVQAKLDQLIGVTSYEVSSKLNLNIDKVFRNLHSSLMPKAENELVPSEDVMNVENQVSRTHCCCNVS